MSVNVTSSIIEEKPKKKFPLLARCKDKNGPFIVYFTNSFEGIVLTKGTCYLLLSHQDNFVDVFDEKIWEILPAGTQISLTLTQE